MTDGQPALPDQCPVPACARVLHSLLQAWFDQSCRVVPEDQWSRIRDLGSRTKTLGLVLKWICPDHRFQSDFAQIKAAILQQNLRNIAWTVKAQELLNAGGIQALFFKGTIRSNEVYAALDCRSSNDIDILVKTPDYLAACALLQQNGYIPQISARSVWWHWCLGESPFRQEKQNSPYIDLHHQIQQPGGPYPFRLKQFFETCEIKRFGRTEVAVPSPVHALLIAIINYGKAARASEPTIARLHEISFALREGPPVMSEDLLKLAKLQGLDNLARDALRTAQILFPHDQSDPYRHPEFEKVLLASLCMIQSKTLARTKMLWRWTDGAFPCRVGRFALAVGQVVVSSLWRWFECRIGRIQ